MIVREKLNTFQLLFTLKGSIIPQIVPQIIFVALLGMGVAITHHYFPGKFPEFTSAPLALIGITLSIFMGFRNNACYDRWWEARKQWGQLTTDARSLACQAVSFIDDEKDSGKETKTRLVYLVIAFTYALRNKLRNAKSLDDIEKYVDKEDLDKLKGSHNVPNRLLGLIGRELKVCQKNDLLSDIMMQSVNERIVSMASVLGACERIQGTPVPFAYRLLVVRTAYLYCLILPFGLVGSLGLATPLVSAIVAYTFFGIDVLSEELDEPFGLSYNDLPLNSMSRSIEINLLETLGETELPEPLQAIDACIQ